jgi:WD40-like Beta Propeller Repeat
MRPRTSTLLVAALAASALAASAADAGAALPGSNGLISFAGLEKNEQILAAARPDGKGLRELTKPSKTSLVEDAAWKSTGKRVLIEYVGGIGIADADGKNFAEVPMPDFPAPDSDEINPGLPWHSPAWSPDSSRFAVQYNPNDNGPSQQIYVISFKGAKPKRVDFGEKPAWDPKDRWIAYLSARGGCGGIRAAKPDGTKRRTLFQPGKRISSRFGSCKYGTTDFDISPDGRRLAFVGVTSTDDRRGSTESDVYVVSIGAKTPRQLTRTGDAEEVVWSPDGKKLAWGGRSGVSTLDVATGKSRKVLAFIARGLAWQPLPRSR